MTPAIAAAIDLRPAVRGDFGFVLDSFGRCLGENVVYRGHVQAVQNRMASQLRGVPGSVCVACLRSKPDSIVGWAAVRDGELAFAYVRPGFRRWGVAAQMATQLIEGGPFRLVYWTRQAEAVRDHGFPLVWAMDTFQREMR